MTCASCGELFDIKNASFNFDITNKERQKKEIACPKCGSTDISPFIQE
ncbi:MAG: hypothetical protein ACTSUE_13540 [Promethearchaeota archaeon]